MIAEGGVQYVKTVEELYVTVGITVHKRENVTLVLAPRITLASFVK